MSLQDNASIVWPLGAQTKAGFIAARNPQTKSTVPFDVVRASTKTRVNEAGLIESVAANVLARDFTYGGCGDFTIEDERTNFLTYSEDFSNAIWNVRGFTKVGTTAGPLGTTGYEFLENNSNSNPAIFYNADVSDGTPRTFGVWLKASTSITIALAVSGSNKTTDVNITTDWQFFNCTSSINATTGPHIGGFGTITQGVGVTIYAAMPQHENGSYSSSYMPTLASAFTRLRDVPSLTGASALLGDSEGGIFIEAASFDIANIPTIVIGDNTTNNRIGIRINSAKVSFVAVTSSSGVIYSGSGSQQILDDTFFKAALRYAPNDFAVYANGVSSATASSGTAFTSGVATTVQFNNGSGSTNQWFGRIRQLVIFNQAPTNTQLAEISTP
jgi:hypothetical protein